MGNISSDDGAGIWPPIKCNAATIEAGLIAHFCTGGYPLHEFARYSDHSPIIHA